MKLLQEVIVLLDSLILKVQYDLIHLIENSLPYPESVLIRLFQCTVPYLETQCLELHVLVYMYTYLCKFYLRVKVIKTLQNFIFLVHLS